jgi:uncharacterized protein YidB (DUF937 family)
LLDNLLCKVGAVISGSAHGAESQSLIQAVIQQCGGLEGLASRFNNSGLSQVFNSWVAIGENGSISAEQIQVVLGNQVVQDLAQKLGIDTQNMSNLLSQLLPQAVDKLTPQGQLEAGQ